MPPSFLPPMDINSVLLRLNIDNDTLAKIQEYASLTDEALGNIIRHPWYDYYDIQNMLIVWVQKLTPGIVGFFERNPRYLYFLFQRQCRDAASDHPQWTIDTLQQLGTSQYIFSLVSAVYDPYSPQNVENISIEHLQQHQNTFGTISDDELLHHVSQERLYIPNAAYALLTDERNIHHERAADTLAALSILQPQFYADLQTVDTNLRETDPGSNPFPQLPQIQAKIIKSRAFVRFIRDIPRIRERGYQRLTDWPTRFNLLRLNRELRSLPAGVTPSFPGGTDYLHAKEEYDERWA